MVTHSSPPAGMPLKQKMATGLLALANGVKRLALGDDGKPPAAPRDELFARTEKEADGEECLHDCETCEIQYPRGFKIDEEDMLYGMVKGWSTHVLVATGKTDWVRDVTHEKGSVMQALGKADGPSNGVSFFFFFWCLVVVRLGEMRC
jgi:glycerol-3-phosphate O-acyltransferase / dihydroxyacetone phosphate acyltransferase